MMTTNRGFALLIAVILASVVLAVGIALLDIAYKQVILSSSAKNSQFAFYNADSALECALYWDQKFNSFSYSAPSPAGTITCNNTAVVANNPYNPIIGSNRVTTFSLSCPGGGSSGNVTIYKSSTGSTEIYANGYSVCDANNPTRIERGLKIRY
jgi:Tfp pilus assembly protein PilX